MAGFVYIMSNPSFADGRIKIGKSDRDPNEHRKAELNSTGVPEPFKVEYSAYVQNHHELERRIHKNFAEQRPNKSREFFTCSIMEAISAIQNLAGDTLKHEDNYYREYEELKRQKEEFERSEELRIKAEEEEQNRQEEAERIRREDEKRQKQILLQKAEAERIQQEEAERIRREDEKRQKQLLLQKAEAKRIRQEEAERIRREEEKRLQKAEEERQVKFQMEEARAEWLDKLRNLEADLIEEYRGLEENARHLTVKRNTKAGDRKKERSYRKSRNRDFDKKIAKLKRKFDNEFSVPLSSENELTDRVAVFRREMKDDIAARYFLHGQDKSSLETKKNTGVPLKTVMRKVRPVRHEKGRLNQILSKTAGTNQIRQEKADRIHSEIWPKKRRLEECDVRINFDVGDTGGVRGTIFVEGPLCPRKAVLRQGERKNYIVIGNIGKVSNTIKFALACGNLNDEGTATLGTFEATIANEDCYPRTWPIRPPKAGYDITIMVRKTMQGLLVNIFDEKGNPCASAVKRIL
jgi:hypothetical protein